MSYVFGIDLGTTYSCVAYLDEYGKPVVLKNSKGENTTPSVVLIESEQNIVVGMEAKRSVEIEPDKTVQFIKRKMGKNNDKVTLNGVTYSAPEISAYILKKIVADANEDLRQTGIIEENDSVKDVVITCPAYFGMNEKQATKTAGELAGLNVLNIINEPTAAAISYGVSGKDKNETVLVYDLGGGTFDITVMNISGSNITMICTGGDDQLGGKDWDECLMDYVMRRYEEETGEDLSDDPDAVASLYIDVETWKKALTSREKVNLTVNGPGGRFREEFTREQYENLTKHLLNRTKNLLDGVLDTAQKSGYPASKIDKILLVGGSSYMPQVSKMIEQDYHLKPQLADPNEAVAKGAAIYANNQKEFEMFVTEEAAKSGKSVEELKEQNLVSGSLDRKFALSAGGSRQLIITNVLSRTYGMSAFANNYSDELRIHNLLMINDKLPASYTQKFQTRYDDQDGVTFEIYETRSEQREIEIEDRKPITVIEMNFLGRVKKHTPISVTFALDNSGLLHIMAEELAFHSKLDTTFQLSNQLSEEEMKNAAYRTGKAQVE